MRKGFNGLCGLVRNEFLQNPLSGDIFIFINRPRNRIKLLHWQGDGFAIYYKRLEKGTYEMPEIKSASVSIELDMQKLLLILEGISLLSGSRADSNLCTYFYVKNYFYTWQIVWQN